MLSIQQIYKTRLFVAVVAILILGGSFYGGYYVADKKAKQESDSIVQEVIGRDGSLKKGVDFDLFWQTWDSLHKNFIDSDKLDSRDLVYGAIEGMVSAAGDPYTVFLRPETAKTFKQDINGVFYGVGMELGKRNGILTVIAPIKDSPADRGGIKAGDLIISVDGENADQWSVDTAVSKIRGERGKSVKITVLRGEDGESLDFTLVRDIIRIPTITYKMVDGIAYIQIHSFSSNVGAEFQKTASVLLNSKAKGIIIDLRDNPGGLLDQAVELLGSLVPRDSVAVQEKFADGTIEKMSTTGNGRLAKIPTVVIQNKGSASASEILAGALRDIRSVRIIGEQSFGKGSVQTLESFSNGSSLKVTFAHWLTPNGTNISKEGIAPTDEVLLDEKASSASFEFGVPNKDPQLDRALVIIRELI